MRGRDGPPERKGGRGLGHKNVSQPFSPGVPEFTGEMDFTPEQARFEASVLRRGRAVKHSQS